MSAFDLEQFRIEAEHNVQEFSQLVDEIQLKDDPSGQSKVRFYDISTLEGTKLVVEFRFGLGYECTQPDDNDTIYETMNALLSAKSAKYRERLGDLLNAKLLDLVSGKQGD